MSLTTTFEAKTMDLAMMDDAVFLVMTFLIAIGLTAAILIWGRATWSSQS